MQRTGGLKGRDRPGCPVHATSTTSSLSRTFNAASSLSESYMRRASFETFPHVSQISFGGAPSRTTSSTKSTSLLSRMALALRACKKMVWSSASPNPRLRTACESCPSPVHSHVANCGGSCASSQSIATPTLPLRGEPDHLSPLRGIVQARTDVC